MSTRKHLHSPTTRGERIADAVAAGMGSWRFIIIQTTFVLLWMLFNIVGFLHHWDSYPFILLNLLFSTQAAYAAPIIMMAQNRQSAIDRKRDDHEAEEVDWQSAILARLDALTAEIHSHTRCAGHTTIETVAPPPPAKPTRHPRAKKAIKEPAA